MRKSDLEKVLEWTKNALEFSYIQSSRDLDGEWLTIGKQQAYLEIIGVIEKEIRIKQLNKRK